MDKGKPAVTHYRVLARFAAYSFLALRLESGRTHQIRVHMAHIQHALVGDPVYGGRLRMPTGTSDALETVLRSFHRQALHASRLAFTHPISGERIECHAPLPADMVRLLDALAASDESATQDWDTLQWPQPASN